MTITMNIFKKKKKKQVNKTGFNNFSQQENTK